MGESRCQENTGKKGKGCWVGEKKKPVTSGPKEATTLRFRPAKVKDKRMAGRRSLYGRTLMWMGIKGVGGGKKSGK